MAGLRDALTEREDEVYELKAERNNTRVNIFIYDSYSLLDVTHWFNIIYNYYIVVYSNKLYVKLYQTSLNIIKEEKVKIENKTSLTNLLAHQS